MISGTGPERPPRAPATSKEQIEGRPAGPRAVTAAPPRANGNGGMAEFRLDRLTDYSEAGILSELARVAGLVPGPALTIARFERHSRVSYPTVQRRFRGWKEALEAAGLGHRYGGQSLAGRMRGKRPARGMSDAAILDAVRAHARALGRDRLTMDDFKHHPYLSAATLWRRFGRWRHAMARAGLKTGRYAGPWSEEECRENLRAVWVHLGRAPTADEMARPPSRIGATAYVRRWGRWRVALQAFAEQANRELAEAAVDSRTEPAAAGETAEASAASPMAAGEAAETSSPSPAAAQGRRHVPISLRFKIMQRDGFRCAACGNSPAFDRRCRLEIDHVVPWSRGGATHPANLRTLCNLCNSGKGDSIVESPPPLG